MIRIRNQAEDLPSGISALPGGEGAVGYLSAPAGLFFQDIASFLNNQDAVATSVKKPKAFINWILFDGQFQFVESSSNFEQVFDEGEYVDGNGDPVVKAHVITGLPMAKSGYLFVFVSNGSTNVPVYFDDLQVSHVRSPLVEETHYYPYGLTMAGISSKASQFGQPENRKKYNGIEFENDLDLNIYDAHFRELDAQTGRWWQIDPVTDGYENLSPYASMYNNPLRYSDPLGNEGEDCCDGLINTVKSFFRGMADGGNSTLYGAKAQADGLISTFSKPSLDGFTRLNPINLITAGVIGSPQDLVNNVVGAYQTGKDLGSKLKSGDVDKTSEAAGFITEKVVEVVLLKKIARGNGLGAGLAEESNTAKSLGNPFKSFTLEEVRSIFENRVSQGTMEKKGPNAYQNKKSGYSYNVDQGGNYGRGGRKVEKPHIDVNYPNPKPKNVPSKKKLDVKSE